MSQSSQEPSDQECLFCRIVSGDLPAEVVVDTPEALAFRDINPQAPVHVLVIPKRHIDNAHTVSGDDGPLLAAMFGTAQRVAEKLELSPQDGSRGYRLVANVGEDASNSISHLHFHVLGGKKLTLEMA